MSALYLLGVPLPPPFLLAFVLIFLLFFQFSSSMSLNTSFSVLLSSQIFSLQILDLPYLYSLYLILFIFPFAVHCFFLKTILQVIIFSVSVAASDVVFMVSSLFSLFCSSNSVLNLLLLYHFVYLKSSGSH